MLGVKMPQRSLIAQQNTLLIVDHGVAGRGFSPNHPFLINFKTSMLGHMSRISSNLVNEVAQGLIPGDMPSREYWFEHGLYSVPVSCISTWSRIEPIYFVGVCFGHGE